MDEYLTWDDWWVQGMISNALAGRDGEILKSRRHDRVAFETPEVPTPEDLGRFDPIVKALGSLMTFRDDAESSWYRLGTDDILIDARASRGDWRE